MGRKEPSRRSVGQRATDATEAFQTVSLGTRVNKGPEREFGRPPSPHGRTVAVSGAGFQRLQARGQPRGLPACVISVEELVGVVPEGIRAHRSKNIA
jgi:hypothetical protein